MPVVSTSRRALLVHTAIDLQAAPVRAAAAGPSFQIKPLFPAPAAAAAGPTWSIAMPAAAARVHPWDLAHQFVTGHEAALSAAELPYVEPDLLLEFPYRVEHERAGVSFGGERACEVFDPDPFWPPADLVFAWHLSDDFSQLRTARDRAGEPSGERVRIAILDTGYDPTHTTAPKHVRRDLERNFVDDDRPDDATDPGVDFPGNQPGHGTATIALLAGNRIRPPMIDTDFNDFLGGAPHAEVVPVRIANSVVHFQGSAIALGLRHAIDTGCAVVSISMGGVPSQAWADAVNAAYEAGIVICAAAGNNFGGFPTRYIVYPARFRRVLAVCGITAGYEPYYRSGWHTKMQGNFGPDAKMDTALAAFTPNMPWAELGCGNVVDRTGAGTSSATPQVAAAAALWLQKHGPTGGEPWQRVEAVRNALFASAMKDLPERRRYFGQGVLRAADALDVAPDLSLPQTPPDRVSFPWLRSLSGWDRLSASRQLMFEVEAAQLALSSPRLERVLGDADPARDVLSRQELQELVAVLQHTYGVSQTLRDFLDQAHRTMGMPPRRPAPRRRAEPAAARAAAAVPATAAVPAAAPVTPTAGVQEQMEATGLAQVIVVLGPPGAAAAGEAAALAAPALPGPPSPDTVRAMAAELESCFVVSPDTWDAAVARTAAAGPVPRRHEPAALLRAEAAPGAVPPPPRVHVYPHLGVLLGTVDENGLAALRASPRVASITAAPEFSLIRPMVRRDARLAAGLTWGLKRLGIAELRRRNLTGKGVLVGHLDTGADGKHPALKGAIAEFAAFDWMGERIEDATPFDTESHGTHTAGTIAGRPTGGAEFGVAPGASLACAVVIEGGNVVARILGGLDWAVERNVRIVSLSLGLRGYREDFLPIVQVLRARNILPVMALGNEGPGTSRSPGNYAEALAVGACREDDTVWEWSSSQRFQRTQDPLAPDLVAPGVEVLSSVPGGGYRLDSGTSMATPHVAGLAALLMEAFPTATAAQVEEALFAACRRPGTMAQERANRGVPDGPAALESLANLLGAPLPPVAEEARPAEEKPKRKRRRTRRRKKA